MARESLRRPEAGAEAVEDLVAKLLRGQIRVPAFQRALAWTAKEVVELFDSIYRGYPVGSLLFWRRPADAERVAFGPVHITAEASPAALWVVDGQQRLTSLVAALGRQGRLPVLPADPFVVYFDPETESFEPAPSNGEVPTTWVPLPKLLDASDLSAWVMDEWPHRADTALRSAVFEAGRRLREYRIPTYVIESSDEGVVSRIFDRVNTAGKSLDRQEIFNALFARKAGVPGTLTELAADLASIGMGTPDSAQLLSSLLAMRGLDATARFDDLKTRHADVLATAIVDAPPVLRRALAFLRNHCGIPHLRLLPYSTSLLVLARFFALHPEPNERSGALLARWVWRSFVSSELDERTLRRRGVAAISDDEEASVQALLELVSSKPIIPMLARKFDARSASTRLALLALASLEPMDIPNLAGRAGAVDVAAMIEAHDLDAFRRVFPDRVEEASSPANRILMPGDGVARDELVALASVHDDEHPFFQSHAIVGLTFAALRDRDVESFVTHRSIHLESVLKDVVRRRAQWGRNDRPSIDYLLSGDAS